MPKWRPNCLRGSIYSEPPSHLANSSNAGGSLLEIGDDWKGNLVVSLQKKEGCSLGLTVSGGTDKGQSPQVSNLRPGSIAHRCDALLVGDFIISVNQIRTIGLRHEEIINLLKNAGTNVSLEVEYEIPQPGVAGQNILTKQQEVVLDKEPSGFGFTLRGGMLVDRMKSHPLTVVAIRAGGPADREGSVKVGDRIIAVNSYRLAHLSLSETLVVFSQCESPATFTVAYDVAVMDEVEFASGPVLLEIDRPPGACIGLTLAPSTYDDKSCVYVSHVQPMSITDRCGALHEGDHILSIDGVGVESMSIAEAVQLLKAGADNCVGVEMVPVTHLENCAKRESLVNNSLISAVSTPFLCPSLSSNSLSKSAIHQHDYRNNNNTFSNNNTTNGSSIVANGANHNGSHHHLHHSFADNASVSLGTSQFGTLNMRKRAPVGQGPERRATSCMSIASSSSASVLSSGKHVCHTETIEVILFADLKGLGMTLKGGIFPSAPMTQPPTIARIEPRSAADKCGALQEGDRILTVNGVDTLDRSLEEINRFLRESRPRCILLVEFDVAESVIPSSGTFIVKLAKKTGDTGITINGNVSSKNGQDLLFISSVGRGSAAHRSGTIQAGDKLLAINDVRLEMLTPDDAMHLLELPDDIVKLKLRRDDPDEGHEGCVIYTVELQRYGGPLGITISGTEDPCDPIVISELTPQGLAERTGAIHIGDRLLAVSGNTTKNKPLSEAIRMLQNAGDVVTLKIARPDPASAPDVPLQPYDLSNVSSSTTPNPSVDSAMESWASSCHDIQGSSSTSNSKSGSNDRSSDPRLPGNVMVLAIPQDSSISHHYNNTELDPDGSEIAHTSLEWGEGSDPSLSSSNLDHGDEDDSDSSHMGDWVKTLEQLDFGSNSEMLRQIGLSLRQRSEVSLNDENHDGLNLKSRSKSTSRVGGRGGAKSSTDIHQRIMQEDSTFMKESKLKEHNKSAIDIYAVPNKTSKKKPVVAPKPVRLMNSKATTLPTNVSSSYDDDKNNATRTSLKEDHMKTIFTPSPVQLQRVVLEKSNSKEDFGFSLSDGLYESGVYINCVRKDSPADIVGLRKYDRLLQVNKEKVQDLDCKQTVPLIAGSGKKLRMVVCRNPLLRLSNTLRDESSDQNGWKRKDNDPKTNTGIRGRIVNERKGQRGKT